MRCGLSMNAEALRSRVIRLLFLLAVTMPYLLSAQDIAGDYSLHGFREVASGLRLSADHTFEFFYTYGASDRQASGTWSLDSGTVVLQGSKKKGQDFKLRKSAREGGPGMVIKISDKNTYLQQSVVCFAFTDRDSMIEESGIDGIVRFNADGIERIELIHAVFPDEPTIIDCSNDTSNYLEFTLNPSLGEVVFDRVAVSLEGQSLRFSNKYLFGDRVAEFTKP